jgi:antitoxin VapB
MGRLPADFSPDEPWVEPDGSDFPVLGEIRTGFVLKISIKIERRRVMSATAKLFMHGRSQAVRLPKEFRFEGTEVRVSKVGDKVILEPLDKPPFDAEAWFARLDELGGRDFLPDGILGLNRSHRAGTCRG